MAAAAAVASSAKGARRRCDETSFRKTQGRRSAVILTIIFFSFSYSHYYKRAPRTFKRLLVHVIYAYKQSDCFVMI